MYITLMKINFLAPALLKIHSDLQANWLEAENDCDRIFEENTVKD